MNRQQSWALPLDAAVELMTARVGYLADRQGAQALIIKGRVAELQGLRRGKVSSDVDVLVRPAQVDHVLGSLLAMGWSHRPEDWTDDAFPKHSLSLFHHAWPCDVDVHWRWPGLAGPDDDSFTSLWDDRVDVTVAGVSIAAPSVKAHACILALNAHRSPWSSTANAELRDLESRVRMLDIPDAIRAEADRLMASYALAPFLQSIGAEATTEQVHVPDPLWNLYTQGPESASIRLIALARSSPSSWPGQLRRALYPSRAALASSDIRALDMSMWQLTLLRFRRLGKAVRSTRSILDGVRRYRNNL